MLMFMLKAYPACGRYDRLVGSCCFGHICNVPDDTCFFVVLSLWFLYAGIEFVMSLRNYITVYCFPNTRTFTQK